MKDYNLEIVWQKDKSAIKQELIDFWRSEDIIFPDEVAEERINQLVMIARDPAGTIIGVCTARIAYIEHLINNFYYFRSYVGEKYRSQGLAFDFTVQTRKFFNQLFQDGIETKVIGVFMEIENEQLKRRNKAVWESGQDWNFYFVGMDSKGNHLRVSYFENTYIS